MLGIKEKIDIEIKISCYFLEFLLRNSNQRKFNSSARNVFYIIIISYITAFYPSRPGFRIRTFLDPYLTFNDEIAQNVLKMSKVENL